MNDIRQKLLTAFQAEHREHLERIRGILAINAQGVLPGTDLDEVFRRAHSLKGAARAVDLRPVETLAHRLETLFSRVREGTLRLDGETVHLVLQALDEIEDLTAALLGGQAPAGSSLAQAAIEQLLGLGAEVAPVAEPPPPEMPVPALPLAETVRVSAASLDRLHRSTGQLLAESLRQEVVTQELSSIARHLSEADRGWQRLHKTASAAVQQAAADPEFSRMAGRLQFLERQMRALTGQVRAVRRLQQRSAYALRHLGQQLQDDIRQARTVTAGSVFEGFGKMVRDLGRDEGKQVELQVSGFEVQADRVVLQALKDPLMHLLRNAVSHGTEPPGERERSGKPPAGQVRLRIEVQGNRLGIWVEDDGRGIDLRGVSEVAAQKGLLPPAAASPQELLRLIFQPGISTVQHATALSGRGMGLSVVHEAVTRLQGEVIVRQREGQGTSMVLWVPLSVAAHPLLLVACQGQVFGVPTHGIARLCRVRLQEVQSVEGRPAITLDKKSLPLLPLAQLLRLENRSAQAVGGILPVMVLKSQEQRAAVAVDALLSVQDGLIHELKTPGRRLPHLTGGTFLEDGSVCLVLNPVEMIEAFAEAKEGPILQTEAPVTERYPPTILVVDDSITTRTLERSILEAHGYRVQVAVDGVEALEQLRAERVDLVVADIQMPRMDGFRLIEEMKKDGRLKQLPVILVTSMASEDDRRRGLELGAGAYIVKQKFDQHDLLETIEQML